MWIFSWKWKEKSRIINASWYHDGFSDTNECYRRMVWILNSRFHGMTRWRFFQLKLTTCTSIKTFFFLFSTKSLIFTLIIPWVKTSILHDEACEGIPCLVLIITSPSFCLSRELFFRLLFFALCFPCWNVIEHGRVLFPIVTGMGWDRFFGKFGINGWRNCIYGMTKPLYPHNMNSSAELQGSSFGPLPLVRPVHGWKHYWALWTVDDQHISVSWDLGWKNHCSLVSRWRWTFFRTSGVEMEITIFPSLSIDHLYNKSIFTSKGIPFFQHHHLDPQHSHPNWAKLNQQ